MKKKCPTKCIKDVCREANISFEMIRKNHRVEDILFSNLHVAFEMVQRNYKYHCVNGY